MTSRRFAMKCIDARALLLLPCLTIVACVSGSPPGGTSAGDGAGGAGSSSSSGTGAGGAPSSGGGGQLPCAIASVLAGKCQSCHGATPLYGAPMSLMTYANTQAPAFSNPSLKVWQMMQMRVHSTTSPMPPAGQPPLATTELAALDSWFSAGAPAGTACTSGAGGTGMGTGTGGAL